MFALAFMLAYPTDTDILQAEAEVWLQCGVMTQADKRNYFKHIVCFDIDRQYMIMRVGEMEKDCPEEIDLYRLPTEPECKESWRICGKHESRLQQIIPFLAPNQQTEYIKLLAEYQHRKQFWWNVWLCWDNSNSKGTRLNLQNLRKFMGSEGYDKGEWLSPNLDIDY